MQSVFALHNYFIDSGDLFYQVPDLMHSAAKSVGFAEHHNLCVVNALAKANIKVTSINPRLKPWVN